MTIRSITRSEGKIRITVEFFGQERVFEFADYGLSAIDHVVNFSNYQKCHEKNYTFVDDTYFSHFVCDADPRIRIIRKSLKKQTIYIYEANTCVKYCDMTYIMYDHVRFSIDNIYGLEFCRLQKKYFAELFDGKHISKQSYEKYFIVVGHVRINMELFNGNWLVDTFTKIRA